MSMMDLAKVMAASAAVGILGDMAVDVIKVLGNKAKAELIPTLGKIGEHLHRAVFGAKNKGWFRRWFDTHVRGVDDKEAGNIGILPWLRENIGSALTTTK